MELVLQPNENVPDRDERLAFERCQAGDPQAFGLVVTKYMKQAYYTALGLVGNHEDALDLSQEAFARAFKARARFDPNQRFFTWYYKILRNLCLNHLRDRARAGRTASIAGEEGSEGRMLELADEHADPAQQTELTDLNQQLWRAMNALEPEEREVLVLREVENCAYQEIAERLNIPVGTVMSRLFYARRRLKDVLEASL